MEYRLILNKILLDLRLFYGKKYFETLIYPFKYNTKRLKFVREVRLKLKKLNYLQIYLQVTK